MTGVDDSLLDHLPTGEARPGAMGRDGWWIVLYDTGTNRWLETIATHADERVALWIAQGINRVMAERGDEPTGATQDDGERDV